ncbi:MAG: N-6 DNA methylase [Candidatus Aenigmarchaeota archaeon]|nr:N-6 DNA methylase [Candidatus Aenigmarchaeota archaeon]
MTAITDYLKKIEKAYAAGNATEHTHRPALKELIENIAAGIIATNEPRRVKCGAPDFIVTKKQTPLGYIECKDIGKSLAEAERTDQMKRYRESLGNLILTDYLEFRWYVGGQYRLTVQLATVADGKIKPVKNAAESLQELFAAFLTASAPTVNSPKELAHRMAALARLIREIMKAAFNEEDLTDDEPDPLHEQLDGFRKVLIHNLSPEQFADMYAQTICYGLFAARCNMTSAESFTRQNAGYALPKTNPFLRKMFDHIAGVNLDERIVWAVDDLAELLHHTDMEAILKDFGKHTRQEDPVVHFYETFLAAYDPKMREARGVYYTPEPVVSYIVRSIDHILKTDFKLRDGLADSTKIKISQPKSKKTMDVHKVQILDPATGTGTFLYGVIDHIYNDFKDDKGMWSSYVSQHLLPRLFGFELLMAPYAVAHMKLGLQLKESGYDFQSSERLGIYLTNTLEEAHAMTGLPLFTQWIAEEANAASDIKKDAPVMVVLGNPPYSGHSANTGEWISNLLRGSDTSTGQKTGNYFEVDGQPLGEKNPKWLNDDYVKFIRFAQWRIEQTGYGILAFISNHGYLDNPTFRGMRQSLMQTFDDIYILDLHGNSKKKERCPDGSEDKNVFDIQQGVAIGIFIKRTKSKNDLATVRHSDLWGKRELFEKTSDENTLVGGKYHWLWDHNISNTEWIKISPQKPFYLFCRQDDKLLPEYNNGYSVTDIFMTYASTVTTARNDFAMAYEPGLLNGRINDLLDSSNSDEDLKCKYNLKDVSYWQMKEARKELSGTTKISSFIKHYCYRPFDFRYVFYHKAICERLRTEVMNHMVQDNIALLTHRPQSPGDFTFVYCTNMIGDQCVAANKSAGGGNSFQLPIYVYSTDNQKATLFEESDKERKPNLSPKFIEDFAAKLKIKFIPDGKGDRKKTFGPEDIFDYMYAIFHSPTYRSRYAEFLKMDFPRLPLTSNAELFRKLCSLGDELVALHLMEKQGKKITGYPIAGESCVETVRYAEPQCEAGGRVWINATQYFDNVPKDVWEFHVGGYQVCNKWLKDRKGRKLTYDDLTHYQQIVSALAETIVLMEQIDAAITASGGWPIK